MSQDVSTERGSPVLVAEEYGQLAWGPRHHLSLFKTSSASLALSKPSHSGNQLAPFRRTTPSDLLDLWFPSLYVIPGDTKTGVFRIGLLVSSGGSNRT